MEFAKAVPTVEITTKNLNNLQFSNRPEPIQEIQRNQKMIISLSLLWDTVSNLRRQKNWKHLIPFNAIKTWSHRCHNSDYRCHNHLTFSNTWTILWCLKFLWLQFRLINLLISINHLPICRIISSPKLIQFNNNQVSQYNILLPHFHLQLKWIRILAL